MPLLQTERYKLEFEGLRTDITTDMALAYYMSYLAREDHISADWWGSIVLGSQVAWINDYGRTKKNGYV